jgi:hypothetical protein
MRGLGADSMHLERWIDDFHQLNERPLMVD